MKQTIFLFICLFFSNLIFSQSADRNFEKCIESIEEWHSRKLNDIEYFYLEDLPPMPPGTARKACDNAFGNKQCKAHKQFCNCKICEKAIRDARNTLDKDYEYKKEQCSKTYSIAKKKENEKEELERREMEKKQKAENEKIAKKQKDEKEKAVKNSKNKSDTAKKSKTQSAPNPYAGMTSEQIARKDRTDLAKKIDKTEDVAYATTATGLGGLMMLLNDEYIDDGSNLKFHLGLGYEALPIIGNDVNHKNSSVMVSGFPNITAGFEGRLNLTKKGGISLNLNPFFSYGWGAFSAGKSGISMSYGGNVTLFFSKYGDSKIHFFAEGAYIKRTGDYKDDFDVSLGTTSDIVYNAVYDYSVLRYGGGIKLQFVKDGNKKTTETYIKPGFFFERPSFANKQTKPVMIGNIQLMLSSIIMIDFSYSKNYLVGGSIDYKNNFQKESKDYFSIKLIRKGMILPR